MSYGFMVLSDTGELLVRQDLRVPHYIGTATYYGRYAWSEMSAGDTARSPLLEYRVTSAGGAPVPVIRVVDSAHRFAVKAVTQLDSTTWRIVIISVSSPTTNNGTNQIQCEVHCFAQLGNVAPLSAYGHRVLDDSGRVSFDSTRGPLSCVTAPSWSGETSNVSNNTTIQTRPVYIGSLTTPGVFGGADARHGLAFWEYTGAYTCSGGYLQLNTNGAALEYGGPRDPINSSAAWGIRAHTAMVIDLYPYL